MGKGTFSHWSRTFLLLEEDFFSSWTFLVRVGLKSKVACGEKLAIQSVIDDDMKALLNVR